MGRLFPDAIICLSHQRHTGITDIVICITEVADQERTAMRQGEDGNAHPLCQLMQDEAVSLPVAMSNYI